MADNLDKREQAKALFLQGVAIAEIARRIDMSRKQVQRWKNDGDWEALRDSLPQSEPPPRPNIVSFDRPRDDSRVAEKLRTPPRAPADMDLLEVVDGAIATIAAALTCADGLNGLGSAAGGLVNLIKLRREMTDDEAFLAEVLKRYRSPRELVARLKEAGWGKSSA